VFALLNRLLDKELNDKRNNSVQLRDVAPVHVIKAYKRSRSAGPSFLTSALGGCELSASRLSRFTPDTH
jgi:hypothetical protein